MRRPRLPQVPTLDELFLIMPFWLITALVDLLGLEEGLAWLLDELVEVPDVELAVP